MKSPTAAGIAARCALAMVLLGTAAVQAQESEEILNLQRLADQEMFAPANEEAVVAEVPALAESPSVGNRLRTVEFELERARNEVARLQRMLAEQDAQHRAELQASYYNMGCVYKAAKQYERAESEFLKVLAINPNDAAVHYNLAILYDDDLQRKDKAREHYQKFLDLAPDDKDVPLVKEWLAELD